MHYTITAEKKMKQENASNMSFVERRWTALLVQTILVTVFEWLGAYLGLEILWDYSRTDFPIIEALVGFLAGLLLGIFTGVAVTRKLWVKSWWIAMTTVVSMAIGTMISFLIWWVL